MMQTKLSWRDDIKKHGIMYLMVLPAVVLCLIFSYGPMYGLLIAFKDFVPTKGILGSPFTSNYGLTHFISFLKGANTWSLIKNTFLISFYGLLFGFPAPILLALSLNEVRHMGFKRIAQTITYLPYFISLVIVCGMLLIFAGTDGIFNDIIVFFGGTKTNLFGVSQYFRPLYVASDIWQGIGWGSILYLAALTSISTELYEAAVIDGANRLQQTLHVTLPGILPTITIMLILRIGSLLNVGYEKIILLYSPSVYDTADVISTYVYRRGIVEASFSFSTAVGLMNSIVSFIIVYCANSFSKKVSDTSLW